MPFDLLLYSYLLPKYFTIHSLLPLIMTSLVCSAMLFTMHMGNVTVIKRLNPYKLSGFTSSVLQVVTHVEPKYASSTSTWCYIPLWPQNSSSTWFFFSWCMQLVMQVYENVYQTVDVTGNPEVIATATAKVCITFTQGLQCLLLFTCSRIVVWYSCTVNYTNYLFYIL